MTRKRSGVYEDREGWFAWWAGDGWEKQSLRTRNRMKAERWRIQGNCHGVPDHDKTCPDCEENTYSGE